MSENLQGQYGGFGADLKSVQFRQEREPLWQELERLMAVVERRGPDGLSFDESLAFATLYRRTLSSLSVAREISLDSGVQSYLEALSARAYSLMYTRPNRPGLAMIDFFVRGLPVAVCAMWPSLLVAVATFALGAIFGFVLYHEDLGWLTAIMGTDSFGGRGPENTFAELRETIYDPGGVAQRTQGWAAFSISLMINNVGVALLAFALGVAGAVPTLGLLFYNGLVIGLFYSVFHDKGLGLDIIAWLSIHGVTEISAIFLGGAAGIHVGRGVLFPGRKSRSARLRENGRRAGEVAMGAVLMLILAGLIEGYFRQAVDVLSWRLFIGWGLGALIFAYFGTGGWWQALRRSRVP